MLVPMTRLIQLLELRQCKQKASSITPMSMLGKYNTMPDIMLHILKDGEFAVELKNLKKYFNSNFHLP